MTLVGRDAERAALRKAFGEITDSGGRVVLVGGPTGFGKTALLYDFAAYAHASGALVLNATGAPSERPMSMGVVQQLLRGAQLPEGIAGRADEWLAQSASSSAGPCDAALLSTFTGLLLDLSARFPLVIGVDDLADVDDDSLEALLWLRRRMGRARILLVLNAASAHPGRPAFVAELTKQPYCTWLELGLFSSAAVAEFLHRAMATPMSSSHVERYLRMSGGNPMLLRGLVEDNLRLGRQPGDLVGGESLRRAVSVCLHRARPEILAVARAWAVFERPSIDAVAGLLPMGSDAVADAVGVLENMGLLLDGEFQDPVIRAAILRTMAAAERSGLHLAAADVHLRDRAGPVVIAGQILAAGRADAEWAVDALSQAAHKALSTDDLDFATRCVHLALTGDVEARQRAALIATRVKCAWRTDPAAALRYASYLRGALTGDLFDEPDATTIAQYLLWLGEITIADLASLPQAYVECGVTELAGVTAPELGDAAQPQDSAIALLSGTSLTDDTFVSLSVALRTLVDHDHPDASAWCERLTRTARERGAKSWCAVFTAISADLALRHGGMDEARAQARLALEMLPARAWGVLLGLPLAVLVTAAVATGGLRDATRLLGKHVSDTMFQTRFGAEYVHARGLFQLAMARPQSALEDFRKCGEVMRAGGFDLPAVVPWRHSAARCCHQLGRDAEAVSLITEQLGMSGADESRLRGVSLALLAELGDPSERVERYEAAVELLERGSDRNELVRALTGLSNAHHARGDFDATRLAASRAVRIAIACGTEIECRRQLQDRNRAVEAGQQDDDGVTALSEAQRRVARLAALGHANREIARMLHITVSTVEQHLTRAYRLLKVTRRTELVGHV